MKNFKPMLFLSFGAMLPNLLWSQAPASPVLMMIKFRNNIPFQEVDSLKRAYSATQLDSTVVTNVKLWSIPDSILNRYSGLGGTMSRIETSYNAQGNIKASTDSLATIRLNTITPEGQACFNPVFPCVSNPNYPVKIFVIDSGIDTMLAVRNELLNKYFNKNLSRNFSGIGNDALDLLNIQDKKGHGTVISHIISQVMAKNYLIGTRWGQELIMLRIFDSTGAASQWGVVKSLSYALEQKAQVVNMSINWQIKKYVNLYQTTILQQIFWQLRDSNILVVASAGNNAHDIDRHLSTDSILYMPGNIGFDGLNNEVPVSLVTVAATNCKDSLASFSNWGTRSVPAAALGVKIPAIDHTGVSSFFSGTSMSSAIVAGLVASRVAQVSTGSRNIYNIKNLLVRDCCGNSRAGLLGMVQFGCTILSEEEAIHPEKLSLKIYPNPATDEIHVNFELNSNSNVQLLLQDLLGRTIQTRMVQGYSGKNTIEWRLAQPLSTGLYLLTLKINQFSTTQKIKIL
jgi:Subtilase family/Secretion system C-terminal sorting domain